MTRKVSIEVTVRSDPIDNGEGFCDIALGLDNAEGAASNCQAPPHDASPQHRWLRGVDKRLLPMNEGEPALPDGDVD
ncbi:MAG: hypothetical protein COA52_06015 [Hyphomicrobiales bacterium]|nr:hypothetical protein [Hyphomicrobiales bacterium]PCJ93973.1 MAG: hypothetical protein COA52_06015 [Hyphomicrobiales bacterium]